MAISFRKYVDITSGVGGGAAVRRRELILRMYTTNELVPPDTVVEMTTLEDVGVYFGTTSAEYLRALFYFGFISKNTTRPQSISFYRYVDADTEPKIFGNTDTKAIGNYTGISDGTFNLTIGGVTNNITVDMTGAADLAAVAALIQVQVRLETEAQFATAVVTFDAGRNSFNFVGAEAEASEITVAAGTGGTNIQDLIGWNSRAIFSNGKLAQTLTETLDASIDISNNFGSFVFLSTLTLIQHAEVARWNDVQNVAFMYLIKVSANDAQSYFDELQDVSGVCLTLEQAGAYHELMPSMILAATNYNRVNSVQNYMFYSFDAVPTVTTTPLSNAYDLIRVNYYGNTQTAGQFLEFYQRGIMMGLATDPVDMNTYANEMWLKDAAGANIMSLLLSLARVSANTRGIGLITANLQSVIDEALNNGVISIGTALTNVQRLFVQETTNDDQAYLQIQSIGYWLNVVNESETTQDGRVEFKAVYTLLYKKDDVIRKVEGTHTLI